MITSLGDPVWKTTNGVRGKGAVNLHRLGKNVWGFINESPYCESIFGVSCSCFSNAIWRWIHRWLNNVRPFDRTMRIDVEKGGKG